MVRRTPLHLPASSAPRGRRLERRPQFCRHPAIRRIACPASFTLPFQARLRTTAHNNHCVLRSYYHTAREQNCHTSVPSFAPCFTDPTECGSRTEIASSLPGPESAADRSTPIARDLGTGRACHRDRPPRDGGVPRRPPRRRSAQRRAVGWRGFLITRIAPPGPRGTRRDAAPASH